MLEIPLLKLPLQVKSYMLRLYFKDPFRITFYGYIQIKFDIPLLVVRVTLAIIIVDECIEKTYKLCINLF